jgi:hypothetical protein
LLSALLPEFVRLGNVNERKLRRRGRNALSLLSDHLIKPNDKISLQSLVMGSCKVKLALLMIELKSDRMFGRMYRRDLGRRVRTIKIELKGPWAISDYNGHSHFNGPFSL